MKLNQQGVTRDGRCLSFGDVEGELRALEDEARAALVPLLTLGPLRVTGADRLDFVHGQVSSEVKRLPEGGFSHGLLLNVKGHALAGLQVYRRKDDLYLASEDGAVELVKQHLQDHIIFDQVELENLTGVIHAFTLQGGAATKVLQAALGVAGLEANTFAQAAFGSAKVLVAPNRRGLLGGYDLHVLSRDACALFGALEQAGAVPAGEEALELSRIAAGIPKAASEGGEGVLPQEAGLDVAVSYTKGCYLGQEIMARIEARGSVRRRLAGLHYQTPPLEEARALMHEGKEVGRRGNAVMHPDFGAIGLAVLRSELEPGAVLDCGGVMAQVAALPWKTP